MSSTISISTDDTDGADKHQDEASRDERIRVSQEMQTLITPHRDGSKPPYSAAELIIIVCLAYKSGYLKKADIVFAIVNTFPYFRDTAVRYYAEASAKSVMDDQDSYHEYEAPKEIVPEFKQAFDRFDVPLLDARDDSLVLSDTSDYLKHPNYPIRAPVRSGRIFLSKWLDPHRNGSFNFLGLLAELRVCIYEMVFAFPCEGVLVIQNLRPFEVLRRADQTPDYELFDVYMNREECDGEVLALPSRIQNLAFLQTNKQIYKEAVGCFYELNRFHIEYTGFSFLVRLSIDRAEFLSDLSIYLDASTFRNLAFGNFVSAMSTIATAERLRRLRIMIHDREWMNKSFYIRTGRRSRTTKITKYGQLPGFSVLAVACGKTTNLEIEGDCDIFKHWIEEAIAKIQTDVDHAPHKAKRQRESNECMARDGTDAASAQGSRTKKTKTV